MEVDSCEVPEQQHIAAADDKADINNNSISTHVIENIEKNNISIMQDYYKHRKYHSEITKLESIRANLNCNLEYKMKQYNQLKELESNRNTQFGMKMVELIALVKKKEHLFIKVPKGPLGSYISVWIGNWIPLVERVLLPYLFIFIVDNRKDYEILLNLIDMVYGKFPQVWDNWNVESKKPDVWITKFTGKRKDVSRSRIPIGIGYTTLMDLLEIRNRDPDIFNVLQEFTTFEKIILFNNEHDAFAKMAEPFRIPRNCKFGYTKDFLKVLAYPSFRTISLYYSTNHRPYLNDGSATLATKTMLTQRLKECQGIQFISSGIVGSILGTFYGKNSTNLGFTRQSLLKLPKLLMTSINSPGEVQAGGTGILGGQHYLLPSLGEPIKLLEMEIQVIQAERDFVNTLLKQKHAIRLQLLTCSKSTSV